MIIKEFSYITIFTNWLSCYAAYCISLTAQREDSCSVTGRVRRAHPTTPLTISGYRLKQPDTFT